MKRVSEQGYTILEIMIFIAVSASMFFIAMIAISGRQQDTQFTQSVRDLDSKLQDVMNDISTGFFNNDGTLSCSVGAGRPVINVGSTTQGSSEDCIFVGKSLHFGSLESGTSAIDLYTLIGQRQIAGRDVVSIQEANPTTIDPVDQSPEQIELQWGLEVFRVVRKPSSGPDTQHGAVSFLTAFNRGIGGSEVSNGQDVVSAAMPTLSIGDSRSQAFSVLDDSNTYTSLDTGSDVVLCVRDAEQDRIASITLTSKGSAKTDTQLDLYDGVCTP